VWRDSIYSIGGYGFWRYNGILIKFFPDRGEWEMIALEPPLDDGPSYLINDSLVVMEKGMLTYLNLSTRRIDIHATDPALSSVNHDKYNFIDCKNYAFCLGDIRILVNKSTGQIFTTTVLLPFTSLCNGINNVLFRNFVHMTDDELTVYFKDGTTGRTESVEEEKQHFAPLKAAHSTIWQYILGLAGLTVISYYFIAKRKRRKSIDIDPSPLSINFEHQKILKFLDIPGSTLSMGELDEILGIDQVLNLDNQKYQRMHLLKDINAEFEHKMGHPLIVRIKDPEDGRRYMYRVEG